MSICRIAGAVLLLVVEPLLAATYHVNNVDGDDANDGGSQAAAFASLKRGVAGLKPGDRLVLEATETPYRESLPIGRRSGLPGKPIVIEGNGAILTGLRLVPVEAWETKEDGTLFYAAPRAGANRPYLVSAAQAVPRAKGLEALEPGTHFWTKKGVYFLPEEGRSVGDYQMEATLLSAGVAMAGCCYVTVRDLTCEFFSNDGFNVHGRCRGLVFENIVGRHNGDDGFSIHEDVGAIIQGGYFHHNNFGIQDVNAARGIYNGILVEDNRILGVDLHGGYHSLVDVVVRNNARDQLQVTASPARHIGYPYDSPLCTGFAFLKNVVAFGGRAALRVQPKARVVVSHCEFMGAQQGVVVAEGAEFHMHDSLIMECAKHELVCTSTSVALDRNLYGAGSIAWQETGYDDAAAFTAYQAASGQDANSVCGPVMFTWPGRFTVFGPRVPCGTSDVVPGVTVDFASHLGGVELTNPWAKGGAAEGDPGAPIVYDFEKVNPWSRVYPQPAQSNTGEAVIGTSELSEEQAYSGTRSAKLHVVLPSTQRKAWLIKLFSLKMAYRRPVRAFRFWLYASESETKCVPRIRDRSGECFYGPAFSLDWAGWRLVEWDLTDSPPTSVAHGDGNQAQDTPPLELVLDFAVNVDPDGTNFTLFVDDLEVEFQQAR